MKSEWQIDAIPKLVAQAPGKKKREQARRKAARREMEQVFVESVIAEPAAELPPVLALEMVDAKEPSPKLPLPVIARPAVPPSAQAENKGEDKVIYPNPEAVYAAFAALNDKTDTGFYLFKDKKMLRGKNSNNFKISHADIEKFARNLLNKLGKNNTPFGNEFLQQLLSKQHHPHKPGEAKTLASGDLQFPRSVFLRWGLFPEGYLEENGFTLSPLDLRSIDMFMLKAAING